MDNMTPLEYALRVLREEDFDTVKTQWSPTPTEFAAYLAKELEHARKNIAMFTRRADVVTLHSQTTIKKAWAS